MEPFMQVLLSSTLFSGISESELSPMLSCLSARKAHYEKCAYVLRAGSGTEEIGLVLSGSALMISEDVWGNRNILSRVKAGQAFALAVASAEDAHLAYDAVAETELEVLFLDVRRILKVCPSTCAHHVRMIHNLLSELAERNLMLSEKLAHMGQRSTRAKLLSYFSSEAQRQGKYEFEIPFSRQELADYLAVERSGLSLEMSKLQREGLITYRKNRIALKLDPR